MLFRRFGPKSPSGIYCALFYHAVVSKKKLRLGTYAVAMYTRINCYALVSINLETFVPPLSYQKRTLQCFLFYSTYFSQTGISCHTSDLHEENSTYDFADAIGTPFCLKVDDRTLQRGIVGLRHRDTTVHEYMHISEVRETLSKFIKF